MTTDELETFVPESASIAAYEKTFAANDEATEKVMDDYPEYWIG